MLLEILVLTLGIVGISSCIYGYLHFRDEQEKKRFRKAMIKRLMDS